MKDLVVKIFKKVFSKEVIFYLIFGVFTTIVNFACFYVLTEFIKLEENLSNTISIITAVVFAYLTNRKIVFNSIAKGIREISIEAYKFFLGRAVTMLLEFFGFMLLFNILHFDKLISKGFITVLVIVLNYFFSKFFAFKKK